MRLASPQQIQRFFVEDLHMASVAIRARMATMRLGPALLFAILLYAPLAAMAVDVRDVRALQAEAAQANDVWTLIQLEAWAESEGTRLRSALPGVMVIGDPLFAAQRHINKMWDQGSQVVAWAGDRVLVWSDSGRPLRISAKLPINPDGVDISSRADFLGMVDFEGRALNAVRLPGILTVAVADARGSARWQTTMIGGVSEGLSGPCVAEDGSAFLFLAQGSQVTGQATQARILVATPAGITPLPSWTEPVAVGPQAGWLIARDPTGVLTLRVKDTNQALRLAARGPGGAVVLTAAGVLARVKADGSLHPLTLPATPGDGAELTTLGRWLILGTGSGATSAPGFDLLGNPTPGGAAVPPTVYGWRWQALESPAPEFEAMFVTPLHQSRDHNAATFLWHDTQINLVDWSGDKPDVRLFAETTASVVRVDSHYAGAVASLNNGQTQIYDADGKELWTGAADGLRVDHPQWAVATRATKTGSNYVAVRLTTDAKAREEVSFPLNPAVWRLQISASGNWAVAWQADGTWQRMNLPSGNIMDKGDLTVALPRAGWVNRPIGRFAIEGPRLFAKTQGMSPASDLEPVDAWRIGRSVVVLGANGTVHVTGRKPNELIEVGRAANADHFMQSREGLTLADAQNRPVAVLVSGPRLVPVTPAHALEVTELPVGPWRASRLSYVPPRSGSLEWDAGTGLSPRRLRNPDNEVLLVPLGSIVLAVDANAAKALGSGR